MTAPSELLFGGVLKPVNRQLLADSIGVDVSTVGRWKKRPKPDPVRRFEEDCQARGADR